MTLTDTPLDEVAPADPPFDAVQDDPSLDAPDMSWGDFVEKLADWPARDGVKILLVAISAQARGQRGQKVDPDQLAQAGGRKKSTIESQLPVLAENGWLERVPEQIPGKNRWTTGWVTTKFIRG